MWIEIIVKFAIMIECYIETHGLTEPTDGWREGRTKAQVQILKRISYITRETAMSERKAFVLDTSAFIAGYEPTGEGVRLYTVPEVLDELRGTIVKLRVQAALDSGKLTVESPKERFTEEVMRVAQETGDFASLSSTDISVLALALQLRTLHSDLTLISEDYSVQNVASRLGIKYRSLATLGISRRIVWETYCPGCHRTYEGLSSGEACPICGTRLKKKPQTKK